MRSRYRVLEPDHAHFITSTIVEWLPVFTSSAMCGIIVDALRHAREHKALRVFGWVIMDNHFHAVVHGPELAKSVMELKRFTARQILAQLRLEKKEWLLNQLAYFRASHKTRSAHQVWQEGYHPQALMGDDVIRQKLEYIHNNPVRRGLVSAPEHWRYSSAQEELSGVEPVLRCDAWR